MAISEIDSGMGVSKNNNGAFEWEYKEFRDKHPVLVVDTYFAGRYGTEEEARAALQRRNNRGMIYSSDGSVPNSGVEIQNLLKLRSPDGRT